MALKINLQLQTPTIELKVRAKDASGATETLKVGFKRYEVAETKAKFEELTALTSALTSDDKDSPELDKFISDEVVYILGANIVVSDSDTGTDRKMTIPDTRTIKPVEALWGSGDECRNILISAYLQSAPYRVSLLGALSKALLNNDYESDSAKN